MLSIVKAIKKDLCGDWLATVIVDSCFGLLMFMQYKSYGFGPLFWYGAAAIAAFNLMIIGGNAIGNKVAAELEGLPDNGEKPWFNLMIKYKKEGKI